MTPTFNTFTQFLELELNKKLFKIIAMVVSMDSAFAARPGENKLVEYCIIRNLYYHK